MILFRHVDRRFPFLWECEEQPPSRWTGLAPVPVNALADTPDGAWAELIRHEEIMDPEDLRGIRASLWAVEVTRECPSQARLPREVLTGGTDTYERCRWHAREQHAKGQRCFAAPSAALHPGGAGGHRVDGGLTPGPVRDARVVILLGRWPEVTGWRVCAEGRPDESLLAKIRHLDASGRGRG